ncbi:MAG: ATP-binding protein [Candidatus Aenigmatarchaeota archaeon]
MEERIETISDLVDLLNERISKNYDASIAIIGQKGSGKSSLALLIAKEFYKKNSMEMNFEQFVERNVVFSLRPFLEEQLSVKEFLISFKRDVIIFDEAFKIMGRFSWFSSQERKKLIETAVALITMRFNNNTHIFCIPDINEFTRFLREGSEISILLRIVERGKAVVLFADEFMPDRFHLKKFFELLAERRKNIFQLDSVYNTYFGLPNFGGLIHFDKLDNEEYDIYERYKIREAIY